MNDSISRKAAMEEISKQQTYKMFEGEDTLYLDANDVGSVLASLPSVQPEQRWIPVSERLPEDYNDVLVWFEYFRYGYYNCLYQTHGIGTYSTEFYSWMINHETGWHKLRVIAWMPLPEPYQDGKQDVGRMEQKP